jgi:DNA-binding NarL/FixJ family response regulator
MKTSPDFPPITIVLVEDHRMFREQLVQMINRQTDMTVCGEADNIRDGLEIVRRLAPTVAIIDITLKGANGLELLKDLRAQDLDVPTLVLSMHGEAVYAERALRAGARGYITKHEASDKLLGAIRQVVKGELYLEPSFMARVVQKLVKDEAAPPPQPVDRLTDREREVFELIGQGHSPRQIGARLSIGSSTIDTYRARIKEKLQLDNAARLYTEAAKWVHRPEVPSA